MSAIHILAKRKNEDRDWYYYDLFPDTVMAPKAAASVRIKKADLSLEMITPSGVDKMPATATDEVACLAIRRILEEMKKEGVPPENEIHWIS